MMIPVHSTLIPLFSIFNKVGLTDHPVSLILSYVAFNMPITIMILLGFYYTKEVEEAAVMDGLGSPGLPDRASDDGIGAGDDCHH